jgi:hypothetical protein
MIWQNLQSASTFAISAILSERGWAEKGHLTPRIRLLSLVAVAALALGTVPAGAGTPIKTGTYVGATTQTSISPSFRSIQFTVRKGKVTLTTEPTVAFGLCLSTPVFTLDGNPTKKLAKNRSFTFTHTFLGDRFDKIHGRFVSPTELEGYAIYHFPAQDLCSEGKAKVNFTAKHK